MQSSRDIALGIVAAATVALGACDQKPAATQQGADAKSGTHTHGPGEDHEHSKGDKHDLGTAAVGPFEVAVAQHGAITPGKETDVDIRLTKGGGTPAAVRAWIGAEDARGSIKAKAEPESDHYHAHVEAPDPIPQDAKLWVEIESAGGERSAGSFPLPE